MTCSPAPPPATTTTWCRSCSSRCTRTVTSSPTPPRGPCRPPPGVHFPTATSRAPAPSAVTTEPAATSATTVATNSTRSICSPHVRVSTVKHQSSSTPNTSCWTCPPLRACSRSGSRPNVLKFSRNLVEDLQPRAVTRDLNWGVPIPLEGWKDNPNKRLYVWFDAVIGYLSASIEWAKRIGDPEAWRRWWQGEGAESFYFMGKDNIVFHSVIWPAILLGESGRVGQNGEPGVFGELNVPTEVVSSEFLTMEGQKFSSSRSVVIYVRDFLERYSADALRYFIMAAGPETHDTDFTWAEFVRRNNDELVA